MQYILVRRVHTGLGDKLLDLCGTAVLADYFKDALHISCTATLVTCDDSCQWGAYRSEDILFDYGSFCKEPPDESNDVRVWNVHCPPGCSLHPLKIHKLINRRFSLDSVEDIKEKFKRFAKNLRPGERVTRCLPQDFSGALGIHLRKSDKVGVEHNAMHGTSLSDFEDIMQRLKQLVLREIAIGRRKFYVCSEDAAWRDEFHVFIRRRVPDAILLTPDFSLVSDTSDNLNAVVDMFALSQCDGILQGIGYSTFSMVASMIRGIPIINFSKKALYRPTYYVNWWKPMLHLFYDTKPADCGLSSCDVIEPQMANIDITGHTCTPFDCNTVSDTGFQVSANDKVLVIARYDENLDWLCLVPEDYDIRVYNKGSDVMIPSILSHRCILEPLPNSGREAGTYLHYILSSWNNLYETVVMCQGDPFPHAPDFIEALKSTKTFKKYHPLTIRYLPDVPHHDDMARLYSANPFYRSERISVYTLSPVYFHDLGVAKLCQDYLSYYKLPVGTNIMRHHLSEVGCANMLPKTEESIRFTYSAIFAVSKNAILQHDKKMYADLLKKTCRPGWFEASILERTWHLLFDKESCLRPVTNPPITDD